MGKINGTVIIPLLDTDAVVHTTSATLSLEVDLPDATTKDSGGYADHIHGLRSWSLTIEGYSAYDSAGNVIPLSDLYLNRTSADMEFAPDDSGGRKFTGGVSLASLELGAPMEETATLSSTLTGKGTLTASVVS